jgi:N,N'-diacetyllegionaminate synthase
MSSCQRSVFIIAEAGVNHNGDISLAKRLIEAAADAGVDAVKFQTFRTEAIVSAAAPKAPYQAQTTRPEESHYDMLKRLELSAADFSELKRHCAEHRLLFMSTPFDLASIDMLLRLGLDIFKIPSGEITNLPYLRKMGGLRKELILSTGMSDLSEIEEAVAVLTTGGTKKEQLTILHCNSEYPTPFEDVNLRVLRTLKTRFGGRVGYSDHTLGIEVPIAAVAFGAEVIEKHFTLDRSMQGPDHKASLEPAELAQMVLAIRHIEKALGSDIKQPTTSEIRNRAVARKSLIAATDIMEGEKFSESNLTVKRPGTGISPMRWDEVIGKSAPRKFTKDEMIVLHEL